MNKVVEKTMAVLANVLEVRRENGGLDVNLRKEIEKVYDDLLQEIVTARRELGPGVFAFIKKEDNT